MPRMCPVRILRSLSPTPAASRGSHAESGGCAPQDIECSGGRWTNQSDSAVLGAPATLLQTAAAMAADWIPGSQTPTQASILRTALAPLLGTQTITIAPQKRPALALPLGWTLSPGTRGTLEQAFNSYLTCQADGTLTCTQSNAYDTLVQQWGTTTHFAPPN